jgi:hypothetical protein
MIFDKKGTREFKLTKLNEARRIAKANSSPTERFIPIKLKSLKELREMRKSSNSRPESVLSLPDKLRYINSIDEDLRFRDVASLSPKENTFSSGRSFDRMIKHKDSSDEECKMPDEIAIISKFNEQQKHNLPQITEKLDSEEQTFEENLERLDKARTSLTPNTVLREAETETTEETQRTKGKDSARQEPFPVAKHKLLYPSKLIKKTGAKMMHVLNMPKRPQAEVLKFIDEQKHPKKLTRSQERGLLDRLQGFSIKKGQ